MKAGRLLGGSHGRRQSCKVVEREVEGGEVQETTVKELTFLSSSSEEGGDRRFALLISRMNKGEKRAREE